MNKNVRSMSYAWEWRAVAFYSNARLFVSWFLLRSLIKVIDSIDSYMSLKAKSYLDTALPYNTNTFTLFHNNGVHDLAIKVAIKLQKASTMQVYEKGVLPHHR